MYGQASSIGLVLWTSRTEDKGLKAGAVWVHLNGNHL